MQILQLLHQLLAIPQAATNRDEKVIEIGGIMQSLDLFLDPLAAVRTFRREIDDVTSTVFSFSEFPHRP